MTAVVQRLDPMLPVENLRTMPEEIRRNTFEDRMISTLAGSFALLATLLASIGLYGVLAYSVAQRTREIGVRMALGADAGEVRMLVLRQVGVMVCIGGVIGLAGAFALSIVAQSMLYQMSGADPLVMTGSVVLLALVALAAGYVPALQSVARGSDAGVAVRVARLLRSSIPSEAAWAHGPTIPGWAASRLRRRLLPSEDEIVCFR